MIGFDRAAAQIGAAWGMAWNRPDWRDGLDRSVDGVFASFSAILFAAPFYVVSYAAIRRAAAGSQKPISDPILEAPAAIGVPAQLVGVLADWAASIVILIFAARIIGAEKRASELIAGYNWIQVPIAAVQAVPLVVLGLAGGQRYAGAFYLPAVALVIALLWGVLRRALATGVAATAGVIILLTLAGLLVQTAATSLALAVFGWLA